MSRAPSLDDGELLTGNLRRNRLTTSEIESEMRLAGIAHMGNVKWAILERGSRSASSAASDGGDEPPPQPKSTEDDGAG